MSPDQIFALIAALIGEPDPEAFADLKAGGQDAAYPVTITPCARPVAPTEIDGKTVICGLVEVPYDHGDPDGRKIDIAFNLYKAHSLSPEPDPVIYLHGGPGDGTVSRVGRTIGFFEHLRARRDIIAIDERGVDSSAPDMDCYATLGDHLAPVVEMGADVAAAVLEQDLIKSCLAELDAKGIDYSLINTEQNAKDVPAVMSALGYDSYNIYGISYGTKLTMEILRQDPPGIRSAIIDGNAPPWLPLYSMIWQAHSEPIRASLEPCERDPVCNAAYPDIIDRTFQLFETLDAEPVDGAQGPIDVNVLYEILNYRVNIHGDYSAMTPYIPLMVTQLEQGDPTIADQWAAGEIPPKATNASAETVRTAALAAGLADAEMAQVDAMLAAAEHIRLAEGTVTRSAQLLETDLDADTRGTDVAQVFDARLAAAIKDLPELTDRLDAGRDYLALRFEEPSADALVTLADTHFPAETASALTRLARQLSPSDLARVFDLIRVDNQATVDTVEGAFQTYLYACQEDFSDGWNSMEKFMELMRAEGSWGPVLQDGMAQGVVSFHAACENFPKHPREDWTSVGTTDVPVLSMNGELDTQTAVSWGALAVQDFANAKLVVVPESGHGTIRFSQCAKDITAAYMEDPAGDLDTSCVEDLRLPVMLPDGTLHPLPY
ncbi:alpha/beta hydrolase [Salipiger abyssi]|uniref:alpha/beta hydrolase n=1 Tax=Salipiger abyssi TaxID=1250539 RepID=UPI001A8F9EE0|nr:alpha/beta hydrolase [Salipiger abyssi]MBN9888973.1 alpha/beta hydrolase [Salipiger abyssi]